MQRYVYVWEFEVQAEKQDEFLRHYGPAGTWAKLFCRAAGYLETILLQDQLSPTRYLTVDRWASSEAYDAFLQSHRAEYERIDLLCESLTKAERSLGSYWEVEPNEGAARMEQSSNVLVPTRSHPDTLGFTFRQRKTGEVEILHRGRLASTLRGRDAADFLSEVGDPGTHDAQQLMARITGNYKHGNERQAATHPRNRHPRS